MSAEEVAACRATRARERDAPRIAALIDARNAVTDRGSGHRDDGSPRSRHPVHHPPCLVACRFRLLAGAVFSPPPQEDGRPRAQGGQPFTRLKATLCDHFGRVPAIPSATDGHLHDRPRRARGPDLRRLAPHRNLHAAVGRREQRVLRQVHVRVRPRRCCGPSRRPASRSCRPGSTRSPASSWAAIPLATMMSQLSGLPDPLRAQGGQDLRHLPARRRRRARGPAALHHRRRRDLGRRDPRRRGRAPGPGRGPRAGRVRDRPRVGRRREARGRGPRAPPAVPRCTSSAAASRYELGSRRSGAASSRCGLRPRPARRHRRGRPSAVVAELARSCRRPRTSPAAGATPGRHEVVAATRRGRSRPRHSRTPRAPMSTITRERAR